MSLTRKALIAMGIENEKIDQIIDMHIETVNALKDERDTAKEEVEKLKSDVAGFESAKKELDNLKVKVAESDQYKKKYEDVKSEFDKFKTDTETKSIKDKKVSLYKKLLRDAKIPEKRIDAVIKLTDFDKVEIDENGEALKDEDTHKKNIQQEWSDLVVNTNSSGADTSTPPEDSQPDTHVTSEAAKRAIQYRNNMYGNPTKEE